MSKISVARSGRVSRISPLRILIMLMVFFVVLCIFLALIPHFPKEQPYHVKCVLRLKSLGVVFKIYADDFDGHLPSTESWCDALGKYMSPRMLICPGSNAREDQSSYAMNEYLEGRKLAGLPPDLVLLFESKPGWNKAGGPEILTTENHGGKGCNILFVDGHVKSIGAEKISELKWTINKSNSDK